MVSNMTALQEKFSDLKILEKRISINFINTVDWRGKEESDEYINNYNDLIDWATHTEIISGEEAESLRRLAKKAPKKASEAYTRAIRLREAAHRIISHISNGEAPGSEDEELLDSETLSVFSYLKLNLNEMRLVLNDPLDLDHILRVVVKDLVELMTSDELNSVKRCQSEECGWLFIDSSKNKSRKWCRMGGCGNRAKARRYYNRSKQAA